MADTDILAGHAATKPAKPAVVFQGRVLDFDSLNRRANRAANMFLSLGCEPDDRVAVLSFNSATGFEITNGLRKAGLVVTGINSASAAPRSPTCSTTLALAWSWQGRTMWTSWKPREA